VELGTLYHRVLDEGGGAGSLLVSSFLTLEKMLALAAGIVPEKYIAIILDYSISSK
jgi:hypothetical protein